MSKLSQAVSIHPYFKVQEGKMDEFKTILAECVALTSKEETCLYYDFSIAEDLVFCREAYDDADALLRHLENVSAAIEKCLTLSEITRVELHGPAAELAKLREPMADLNPTFFEHFKGVS